MSTHLPGVQLSDSAVNYDDSFTLRVRKVHTFLTPEDYHSLARSGFCLPLSGRHSDRKVEKSGLDSDRG